MKNVIFLLGLLFVGCDSANNVPDKLRLVSIEPITEKSEHIIEEQAYIQLFGFEGFLFVKDSLTPELENCKVLTDTYSELKLDFNQLEKDTSYFIVLEFMKEISIAPEDDKALYEYDDIKETEIAEYYEEHGILISSAEGEYYCVPDYTFLANVFNGDLNPELTVYSGFLILENKPTFYDGGLIITWMELAKQIIETEDFYSELKDTKYSEEVFTHYTWKINALLYGTENSILIDETDSLRQLSVDALKAYEFLMSDSVHNSGNLFSVHFKNMKVVNYEVRGEAMHYLTDKEIEDFLNEL